MQMYMRRYHFSDKKLLLLIAFLLLLVIAMGLIWRYYDIELREIEKQKKELKLNIN